MEMLYCYNRWWSKDIFEYLTKKFDRIINFKLITDKKEFDLLTYSDYKLLLLIGWSYIVPLDVVNSNTCICLHPSPLPKYRGGSPLQNQIINGETESCVTLLIMNDKIDAGPIISQYPFSLKGNLNDIINNMVNVGKTSLENMLTGYLKTNNIKTHCQDDTKATMFKRMTKEMSEITINDINNSEPLYLYNKIRSLQHPYPNAFIRCKNNKKLYITQCEPEL